MVALQIAYQPNRCETEPGGMSSGTTCLCVIAVPLVSMTLKLLNIARAFVACGYLSSTQQHVHYSSLWLQCQVCRVRANTMLPHVALKRICGGVLLSAVLLESVVRAGKRQALKATGFNSNLSLLKLWTLSKLYWRWQLGAALSWLTLDVLSVWQTDCCLLPFRSQQCGLASIQR